MSEDKEDKPFAPTERKLRQARDKGDVPRSIEVNALLAYTGMFVALVILGPKVAMYWLVRAGSGEGLTAADPETVFATAHGIAGGAMLMAIGPLLLPGLLVLAGLVVQRTLIFTPSRLAPDIKRINPVSNAAQKFGVQGLVTFALSVAKVGLAGAGGWWLFVRLIDRLGAAGYMNEAQWLPGLSLILRDVLILALAITALLAVADLLWKHFDHHRRQMMTRKEMEEEHKESEGDPYLKARRRERAVDIALGTMLADVERADVVIVNPTHFAVALEWKRGSGRAPVCLAKGTDEVAARIRERAATHEVPIWSDPPCARALYSGMEIGDEIPVEHFAAVAAAIRFAEAMRRKARQGW